jgi:hypothetical protein
MGIKLNVLVVAMAFALLFVSPSFAWFDSNYGYRTQINVTNNAGDLLTNYDLILNSSANLSTGFDTATLISQGKMQSDCDDILVVDSTDSASISFYVENSTCNSPNTIINTIVNLSTGVNTFYIYYNSSAATNHQNMTSVLSQLSNVYSWYDFSENSGTVALDKGSKGNNVTFSNNAGGSPPTWTIGRGSALDLNHAKDFANATTQSSNGTRIYTIEAWIWNNDTSTAGDYTMQIFGDMNSGCMGFRKETSTNTTGFLYQFFSTTLNDWVTSTPVNLSFKNWVYFVMAINQSDYKVYLNGNLNLTQTLNYPNDVKTTSCYNWRFGQHGNDLGNRNWNGTIDNFRWQMNYIPTSAEVKAKYDGLAFTYGQIEPQTTNDTSPPIVTIQNPTNATNVSSIYLLNFTAIDNFAIDKCWYINTTGNNNSLTLCGNTIFTEGGNGFKQLTVCANDTSGNTGCANRNFTRSVLPSWSLNSTNNTNVSSPTKFSIYWLGSGVPMDGYVFYICNGYSQLQGICGTTNNITRSSLISIRTTSVLSEYTNPMKCSDGTLYYPYADNSGNPDITIMNSTNNGTTWKNMKNLGSFGNIDNSFAINSLCQIYYTISDGTSVSVKSYNPYSNATTDWYTFTQIAGKRNQIKFNSTDGMIVAMCPTIGDCYVSKSSDGLHWINSTLTITNGYNIALEVMLYINRNNVCKVVYSSKSSGNQDKLVYWNSSDCQNNWISPVDLTPYAHNNSYINPSIIEDFNNVTHVAFSSNPSWTQATNEKMSMLYLNDSGNGTWSFPAITIVPNTTISSDRNYLVQIQNHDIYLFGSDNTFWQSGGDTSGHNNTYYVWTHESPINWSTPQIIDNNSLFSEPRGTTFPIFNSNDNSNVIDVVIINTTNNAFAYMYLNLTINSSMDWSVDPFAHFGATNWANVTKVSNNTANLTVAYYWVANDTTGVTNTTPIFSYNLTQGADIIPPTITIQNPQNATYNTLNLSLNYVASDTNLDTCVRELNGVNTTITPKCSNQTFLAANNSLNLLKVFVNDTQNNTVVDSVYFTIDTLAPQIDIILPINTTYNSLNTSLIFTINHPSGTTDKCWYILNGGANTSLPSCNNITFTSLNGTNNMTVYANDTGGNTGSHSHAWTTDITAPNTSIQIPTNTSYFGNTSIYLSYTTSDANGITCRYRINNGAYTLISGCTNITIPISSSGAYDLDLNTTDNLNNSNINSVGFTIIYGVSVSAFLDNGNAITNWSLSVTNGTDTTTFSISSNPYLINTSQLYSGFVIFNATKTGYDSETWNATVNSTLLAQHNFTIYPYSDITFYDTIGNVAVNDWILTVTNNSVQYITANSNGTYVVSGRTLRAGTNTFAGSKSAYSNGNMISSINRSAYNNVQINTSQISASMWAVDEITLNKIGFNAEFILINGNITVVKATGYRSGTGCLFDFNLTSDCEQNTSVLSPYARNLTVMYGQDYNNATYQINYLVDIVPSGCEQPYGKVFADGHEIFSESFGTYMTTGRYYINRNITVVNSNYSYNRTINFSLEFGSTRCGTPASTFGINEFRQMNNTAGYVYVDNYTISIPTNLISGYNQYVVNFRGDPTVQSEYSNQRTYYITLSNNTNFNIIGYLLKDTGFNGFFQYWTVLDANNLPIPDATITIGRWYGGTDTTIGQCVSNLAGSCRIWIQAGQLLYSLRAEHPSYTTNYTSMNEWTGSPNPAYVYLKQSGAANFSSIYNGLTITISPNNTYLRNATNATCQVLASLGNLQTLNMTVYRTWNGSTYLFGSQYTNSNPNGATLRVLMNQVGKYSITCQYTWTSNSTGISTTYDNKQSKTVWLYADNMENSASGNIDETLGIFLVLVILLIVCVPIAYYSPTYAALVGIIILFMVSWIGLLPPVLIGGTMVEAWMIISLVVLTLIAFVFLRSGF